MTRAKRRSHQEWCELIKTQAGGEQTVAEFCQARGLSSAGFYFHRSRMKKTESTGFREVSLSSGSSGIALVVEGTPLRVEVDRGFDAACLREVVDALR